MTVHTCKECGQTFLSWKEFDSHVNKHLQKHLDEFAPNIPEKKTPWEAFSNIPEGMNRDLFKIFERYNLGQKVVLCLWRNGRLNCAIHERSREQELKSSLSEWLQE
ncbi:MAG: hypothetical protein WCC17_05100 [Candidatus Nitrosopolaris sp.]